MKKNKVASNKLNNESTQQIQLELPIEKITKDVVYLHVNKTSFQQNFKVLISHYKREFNTKF